MARKDRTGSRKTREQRMCRYVVNGKYFSRKKGIYFSRNAANYFPEFAAFYFPEFMLFYIKPAGV